MLCRVVPVWVAASRTTIRQMSKLMRKRTPSTTRQTYPSHQSKTMFNTHQAEITGHLSPTPLAPLCASSKPGESLPDTSCCPGNPTGTMPRLFMAVAQAVGSVTDMLSWVVSIAILPKPSAAAGKTNPCLE